MGTGREMRKFLKEITAALSDRVEPPASPLDLFKAMCAAVSEMEGRKITLRLSRFPDDSSSGLLLDLGERGLVVVIEERTSPDHQLVILGHELWHQRKGHCTHGTAGSSMAARLLSPSTADWEVLAPRLSAVAARTAFDEHTESEAERFGLALAAKFRPWLNGPHARGPLRTRTVEDRISASLIYRGQL
ncbi:toxin-antitoxin system, toxin component [Streptomyces sp. NPDC054842]